MHDEQTDTHHRATAPGNHSMPQWHDKAENEQDNKLKGEG